MKFSNILIIVTLGLLPVQCTKIEQPVSYAPVITFSNYKGYGNTNPNWPWIQNDTVVIGYPKQEYTVNIAAPNAISEVVFSGPDTSGTIKQQFDEGTYFNFQIMISRPCPARTLDAKWAFKATDRRGQTTEKKVHVVYVDTFKLFPAYAGGDHMGFDIVNSTYVNPYNSAEKSSVDIIDKKSATSGYNIIFLEYLSHTLHATPESGTTFMKIPGLSFTDLSIKKAYLQSIFTNPTDSISQVAAGDVVICKLRNTNDFALLKVVKTEGSNAYTSSNFYVLGHRKISE
jgi:hypothetical protein